MLIHRFIRVRIFLGIKQFHIKVPNSLVPYNRYWQRHYFISVLQAAHTERSFYDERKI